jgi:tRNA(His) guanylyltransferase
MQFSELDVRMRQFETTNDLSALPDLFMVARLDGRNFTRLTKEIHRSRFQAPFDETFRDLMLATTEHLMDCGFRIVYGYTQSDEIFLLFHPHENSFGRKLRKYHSVLAGEASARFSLLLGDMAAFDCRLCQLPTAEHVVDYFRWRSEDAHRNALNGHCYWLLRGEGMSVAEATQALDGRSVAHKNELLFQRGINFNELPAWQRRGTGLYWRACQKTGTNPLTGETVTSSRRKIYRDLHLPMRETYDAFILEQLNEAG